MTDPENAWGAGLWAVADLVTPMAVRVAATLRVADHIIEGRRTAREIAEATGADVDALGRVLRHLVTAGVLCGDDAEGYVLTPVGEGLRDDHPDGVRRWIDLEGAVGHGDLSLATLLHTVRTGAPAFPAHFGLGFWEDLAADAQRAESFDALMGAQLAAAAPAIAQAYDWGSLGTVVDLGGGNATMLTALLRAHPNLRGTVLDLPAPAKAAAGALADAGLGDRGGAVAGSFFEPLPGGAGGYLLSAVIHDWDDAEATEILRRCAAAARPSGRVFVVDVFGEQETAPDSTEMDLRMLAYFKGRERSLRQLRALAAAAALEIVAVVPVADRSIVELAPR